MLNKHFTAIIYRNISRSLFQDHILVFSFILCVGILRGQGKINDKVWAFFLTGETNVGGQGEDDDEVCDSVIAVVITLYQPLLLPNVMLGMARDETLFSFFQGTVVPDNPAPSWLTDKSWLEIVRVSSLEPFEGLSRHLQDNPQEWKEKFYDSTEPHRAVIPGKWKGTRYLINNISTNFFSVIQSY